MDIFRRAMRWLGIAHSDPEATKKKLLPAPYYARGTGGRVTGIAAARRAAKKHRAMKARAPK